MTDKEILVAITNRWTKKNLGLHPLTIGQYLVKLQGFYNSIIVADVDANNDDIGEHINYYMCWIFAYNWALLRWSGDLPGKKSATPLPDDLNTYPLELAGINWNNLSKRDFSMLANTYINDLSHAWRYDPLWSGESLDAARYLFQICKQFLLRYGIPESDPYGG